jgi:hypothetical protein
LWSWGVLLPIAIVGALLAARNSERPRTVLALACGSLLLLALSVLRGELGWGLGGNATLLHQGRAWPVMHLLGGAFGGVALLAGFDWLSIRDRALALIACVAVFTLGLASPWFASRRLTEVIRTDKDGFIYARYDLKRGSFIREVADRLGPDDVVYVEDENFIGLMTFSFSGARLARYESELAGNDLRIRFADLAAQWNDRMAAGGFVPDYILVEEPDTPPEVVPLLTGEFGSPSERWVLLDVSP